MLTVILLRPAYIESDVPQGTDTYFGWIESNDMKQAVQRARQEVFDADKDEGLAPLSPSDYPLIAVLAGCVQPVLYGWQE